MAEETKVATTDAKTEDKAARVIDGFDNFVSRVGLNNNNVLSSGIYTFNLMTRNRIQLEAAYRGSWISGKVVDQVAEDMTRAGVSITTNEGDNDIKEIKSATSRLRIAQSLNSLIKWGRLYGGAIGVIHVAGQDLGTPLDIATVAKGQFTGISVYDRWQVNPDLVRLIPDGPDMGLPAYYYLVTTSVNGGPASQTSMVSSPDATGQIKVHHSRVIRNIGIELPFWQAITEMLWGESVLERLWDRLIPFDDATLNAANLVQRANNRTVGIDGLREIIAAGGKAQQGLEKMFEMMREFQTNEGLTLLDKNDQFQTSNYTFSGLADVLLQFGQQLSGATGIPLVILFGQSPAGLNSTGESDIRTYYDSINSQQESRLRSAWEKIIKLLWRSALGKDAPKDMEFKFVPLWQMSATDQANVNKTNAETIIGALDAGIIDRPTAMKELRDQGGDSGMFSNITDEEIDLAEKEAAEAPPEPDPADPEPKADEGNSEPGEEKEPVKNLDSKKMGVMAKLKKWAGR